MLEPGPALDLVREGSPDMRSAIYLMNFVGELGCTLRRSTPVGPTLPPDFPYHGWLGRDLVLFVASVHHDLERIIGQRPLQRLSHGARIQTSRSSSLPQPLSSNA